MLILIGRIANVAEGQNGHVTEEQARRAGASPADLTEFVAAGVAEWVIDGVLRLRGGGRHPFPRLYAQWLRLEPEKAAWERVIPETGVVSHRSALRVHELGDLPFASTEFTSSTASVSLRAGDDVIVHTDVVTADEWTVVDGLPVTTVARTLADLMRTAHPDLDALGKVTARILDRQLARPEQLAAALDRCAPPQGGHALLDELIAVAGARY